MLSHYHCLNNSEANLMLQVGSEKLLEGLALMVPECQL